MKNSTTKNVAKVAKIYLDFDYSNLDDFQKAERYGGGPSIERTVSFLVWRLGEACKFLLFLAGRVAEMRGELPMRPRRCSSLGLGSRRKVRR